MKKGLVFLLACVSIFSFCLSACGEQAPAIQVEENAIVASEVDSPTRYEFRERIPQNVLERHADLRNITPSGMVERVNPILEPFGYRLEPNPIASYFEFFVYQGEEKLPETLTYFWMPSVRTDGKDFVLPVELPNGVLGILQKDGLKPWEAREPSARLPLYAGNDLVYVAEYLERVVVTSGTEELLSVSIIPGPAPAIKTFLPWKNGWVLEVNGEVYYNEKKQNEIWKYPEMFDWSIINGKPFFFFQDAEGKIGLNYNGKDLGVRYESVPHYQCCEPSMFNPSYNGKIVWFYALKDNTWYYVEAGGFTK